MDDELKKKIQRARAAGMPEDVIQKFTLRDIAIKQQTTAPQTMVQPRVDRELSPIQKLANVEVLGIKAAPIVGGVAGGIIGGPGGAAIGAAGAEALRQTITGEELQPSKILTEGALSLAGAGAGKVLGTLVRGGTKLAGLGVKKLAFPAFLRPTPGAVGEVVERGLDLEGILSKWAGRLTRFGSGFDEILGPIKKGGRELSQLSNLVGSQEQLIEKGLKGLSKQKLSGNLIIKSLKDEALALKDKLGEEAKYKALTKVIDQAVKKYKGGIGVLEAREILKKANMKFGESILDLTGAVAKDAQKVEANVIRQVLRNRFPHIAQALDNEQELLVLEGFLKKAREKAIATGVDLAQFDITRPGTFLDLVFRQPEVTMKIAGKFTPQQAMGVTQVQNLWQQAQSALVPQLGARIAGKFAIPETSLLGKQPDEVEFGEGAAGKFPPSQTGGLQMTPEKAVKLMLLYPKQKTLIQDVYKMLNPKSKPLGSEAIKMRGNAQTGINAVNEIQDTLIADPTSLLRAAIPGSLTARKLRLLQGEMRDVLEKLRTGAAVNPLEFKEYKANMPSLGDTGEEIAYKLKWYKDFFGRLLEGVEETRGSTEFSLPASPTEVEF